MGPSAIRSIALTILAVALGAVILMKGADFSPSSVSAIDTSIFEPTVEADELGDALTTGSIEVDTEAAPIVEPTEIPAAARPNTQVRVLVVNGTDVAGEAARLNGILRNDGFNVRTPRNANPHATSLIYYRSGFGSEAEVVRAALSAGTQPQPMPQPDPVIGDGVDLAVTDILVVIGGDNFAGN